jgi:hypothetical protein
MLEPDQNLPAEATILGPVINAVKANVSNFEVIFQDFARYEEVLDVADDTRYPMSLYVEMVDYMEARYGYGAMLKLGKAVGQTVIDVSLSKLPIKNFSDAIHAVQSAHEFFCEPTIGAFKIIRDDPRLILVEYSAPYNCRLQEGLFATLAKTCGGDVIPIITQQRCRREGAPTCIYQISLM